MRTERGDDGQATIFVVTFAVVLLVLAGLVVDGGLALNARQRVADDVEQAARAGAQRLDEGALRATPGRVVIDPGPADRAARAFLIARGYPGDRIVVNPQANAVTVRATIEQPTALLSLVFIDHFTVTAQGQARPAVGINGEGTP
jgi:Flp pilus assembly protein TadG